MRGRGQRRLLMSRDAAGDAIEISDFGEITSLSANIFILYLLSFIFDEQMLSRAHSSFTINKLSAIISL